MTRKIIISLLAILALVFGFTSPASATPAPSGNLTITLDPNDTGLDLYPTAADLSKNTGITVRVGTCAIGPQCIEFTKDECVGDGTTVGGGIAGCAWMMGDMCHVSIEESVYDWDYWMTVKTISHEATHCLTSIFGYGVFHIEDDRSILATNQPRQTLRASQTKLFSADRAMISEMVAGTWDGVWQ